MTEVVGPGEDTDRVAGDAYIRRRNALAVSWFRPGGAGAWAVEGARGGEGGGGAQPLELTGLS